MGATHGLQGMHRDSAWVDQWQEESDLWNSHGLEGADKPCHRQTMSPTNHVTDCYFCAVDVTEINRRNRGSLRYPDLQSAHRPGVHCDEIPVPIIGELPDIRDEDASSVERHEDEEVVLEDNAPHPFSQKELNDLVRDLSSSTDSANTLSTAAHQDPLKQAVYQGFGQGWWPLHLIVPAISRIDHGEVESWHLWWSSDPAAHQRSRVRKLNERSGTGSVEGICSGSEELSWQQ